VDEAAEQIAAPNVERQDSGRDLDWAVRRGEPEGTVGPVLVVVANIDTKDAFEMSATDDQEMVEAIGAHGAHPALGIGVRVRRPYRRLDHADALAAEDLVEAAAELRVAVMD
jgi:hypothetical protein